MSVAAELERAWCAEYPEPWGDTRGALACALAPLAVALVYALAFAGGALDRLVRFVPSAAPVAGVGHRMLAVVGSQLYGAAASAALLPSTAVWLTVAGLTLADSDTTADAWASSRGGVAATLTAPAATNRPAYTAGAVPVLTFDGTDNVLRGTVTKGSAWDSYEWGAVVRRAAHGTTGDIHAGYFQPTTERFSLSDQDGTRVRASVLGGANVVSTNPPDPDDATLFWSCDADAGTINIRTGGAVDNTGAGAVTSRNDGGLFAIGANTTGGAAASGTHVAACVGPALTADQRTYLRALLTYCTGVTC